MKQPRKLRLIIEEPGSHIVSSDEIIPVYISLKDFDSRNRVCIKYKNKFKEAVLYDLFYSWKHTAAIIYSLITNRNFSEYDLIDEDTRKVVIAELTMSPKTLHKCMRHIISTLIIDPLKPYAHRFGLSPKVITSRKERCVSHRWDFNKLNKLAIAHTKIQQLELDGLMPLTPLVIYFNKTPKELRKLFGKATWKGLSKNSLTRNNLIIKHIEKVYDPADRCIWLNEVPSTVLKATKYLYCFEQSSSICKIFKLYKDSGLKYKNFNWNRYMEFYNDTVSMSKTVGCKFKPKTWEDIVRLHDKYFEKIIEKTTGDISTEVITVNIPPFNIGDFKCTPLLTELDFYKEGKLMHHCIYTYYNRVKELRYYVIHLEHISSGEKSTLGLVLNHYVEIFPDCGKARRANIRIDWEISQHYGMCNQSPVLNKQIEQEVFLAIVDKLPNIKGEANERA